MGPSPMHAGSQLPEHAGRHRFAYDCGAMTARDAARRERRRESTERTVPSRDSRESRVRRWPEGWAGIEVNPRHPKGAAFRADLEALGVKHPEWDDYETDAPTYRAGVVKRHSRVAYGRQLRPFSLEDTRNYVRFHLRETGAQPEASSEDAIRVLFTHSRGAPRANNHLALHAMIQATVHGTDSLDGRFLEQVVAAHPLYSAEG